jgi:PAS domain S-box-containing protein
MVIVQDDGSPPLSASNALNSTNHGMRIKVQGRLVNDVFPSTAPELTLESDGMLFTAVIEAMEPGKRLPTWKANSVLSVTGVCFLRVDESRTPQAFRLLLQSPEDVVVLQPPPWFTTQNILFVSIILLVAVFAALAWIVALRRHVSVQTAQIKRRLESEAAAQQHLALIWENSADGMILTNSEGITVQVNNAYCAIMQKKRHELEGKSLLEAFVTDNPIMRLEAYKDRFTRRILAPRHETQLVLWNGKSAWFDLSNMFLERANSSPILLSQFRDITERKLAEQEKEKLRDQLVQAQKTESIGRLAGGVAHDFNNMLQVIIGNAMMALEEIPAESKIHDALEEIQKSANRSADLTRQLLAFARKQTVIPKVLNLNDTISSLLKMLQRLIGENIQLIWNPGTDLHAINIDPAQIDQILVNLCINARDAIKGTGKITITTANTTIDNAFVRTHLECDPGNYVMLAVADTGHGIDDETRMHLFEPFFTTKTVGKGTGLGLATIFGIVKQNQGFIDVQSKLEHGTIFNIYLPRSQAEASGTTETAPKISLYGNETVLFVEDEQSILSLGQRILIQNGYKVLAAQNPDAALAMAMKHDNPIQMLITDVVMPGMNGKELKQAIEAIHPGIRCIFISGYTADIIAHHGLLEEGLHFIQKPFSNQTLLQKVREVFDKPA